MRLHNSETQRDVTSDATLKGRIPSRLDRCSVTSIMKTRIATPVFVQVLPETKGFFRLNRATAFAIRGEITAKSRSHHKYAGCCNPVMRCCEHWLAFTTCEGLSFVTHCSSVCAAIISRFLLSFVKGSNARAVLCSTESLTKSLNSACSCSSMGRVQSVRSHTINHCQVLNPLVDILVNCPPT